MKICTVCHIEKPLEEFYLHKSHQWGVSGHCKVCCGIDNRKRYHDKLKHDPQYKKERSEYSHDWHIRNKEKRKPAIAANHRNIRLRCIEHYGGTCACCGENRYEFLAIDHINGGGGKHRKKTGGHTERWLVKNNFPQGYRILCHNCNQSLGLYGYCPHKKNQGKEEII